MSRILLTGATGMVGRCVVDRLTREGEVTELVGLVRRPEVVRELTPDIEWIPGDLADPASLRGAVVGCDVVLHVAGAMPADPEECLRVNRDSTCALVEDAVRAGARRFVYVSSVAVYGDRELVQVTEETARAGQGVYARAKREAEDAVLHAGGRGPMEVLVLRPCPILGVGPGHLASGLAALARMAEIPVPAGGQRRVDLVDADQVAATVVAGAQLNGPVGAYHLSGGDALTLREILEVSIAALGTGAALHEIPVDKALESNRAAESRGEPSPIPPALIAYAMYERTYDASRARRDLGLTSGDVREALAWAVAACA